jgi:hypothetical protein
VPLRAPKGRGLATSPSNEPFSYNNQKTKETVNTTIGEQTQLYVFIAVLSIHIEMAHKSQLVGQSVVTYGVCVCRVGVCVDMQSKWHY